MVTRPYEIRAMLRRYDKQLVAGRRIAQFQRRLRAMRRDEEPSVPRVVKRGILVEQVAREIIDNLIVVGSPGPLVEEIKDELATTYGHFFLFEYPFMQDELIIRKQVDDTLVTLGEDEYVDVLGKLWEITLSKVDETMI